MAAAVDGGGLFIGEWWRILSRDALWAAVVSEVEDHLRAETGADVVTLWLQLPPTGDWLRLSDDLTDEAFLPAGEGPAALIEGERGPRRFVTDTLSGPYRRLIEAAGVRSGFLVPLGPPTAFAESEHWRAVLGLGWRGTAPRRLPHADSPALTSGLWYLLKERVERAYTETVVEAALGLGVPATPEDWAERLEAMLPALGGDHWTLFRAREGDDGWHVAVEAERGRVAGHGEAVVAFLESHPDWRPRSAIIQAARQGRSMFVPEFGDLFAGIPDRRLVEEVRSGFVLPLGAQRGEGVGVLVVYWNVPSGWRQFGLSLRPWDAFRRVAAEWWQSMHNVRDATHDPLTGLLNRRGLMRAWQSGAGEAKRGTLGVIDVDRFADVNNRWGHLTGDRVLSALASAVKELAAAHDGCAARWGGDEFVFCAPHVVAWSEVGAALQRMLDAAARDDAWPEQVTLSGGAITWRDGAPTWEEAFAQADRLLYRAKREGRMRFLSEG